MRLTFLFNEFDIYTLKRNLDVFVYSFNFTVSKKFLISHAYVYKNIYITNINYSSSLEDKKYTSIEAALQDYQDDSDYLKLEFKSTIYEIMFYNDLVDLNKLNTDSFKKLV